MINNKNKKEKVTIYYYNFSQQWLNTTIYSDFYEIEELIMIHSNKLNLFYTKNKNV